MTSPTTRSDFQHLQQLVHRDRLRKLLVLLLLTGVSEAAIYAQAVWLLMLITTGLVGLTAWQRRRCCAQERVGLTFQRNEALERQSLTRGASSPSIGQA
jgi:hypothetical protein